MEPEKQLEKMIEEIIREPLSLDTLRKIIDMPHKYSVDDFMRIITADPVEFEDMARRIVLRDAPVSPISSTAVFEEDFDMAYDFIGGDVFARNPFYSFPLSEYINISLYYTLISRYDDELREILKKGKEISRLSNIAAKAYYSSLKKVLGSKIDFDRWVELGKEIALLNKEEVVARSIYETASQRYFKHSKDVLDLGIDFFDWGETGKELARTGGIAGFIYFRSSILALRAGIDFDMWVRKGKEIMEISGYAGHDYFEYSESALKSKIDFLKWAETGKDLTVIDEKTGRNYFSDFKKVLSWLIEPDKWLGMGRKILGKNKGAGIGYFANSVICSKAKKLAEFLNLIEEDFRPEDYDFLKYRYKFAKPGIDNTKSGLKYGEWFRHDKSRLNEMEAMKYLLSTDKNKGLALPEVIEHNVFYTEELGSKIEERGRKLFRQFYFAVTNRKDTYVKRYADSDYKEVFDAIRGHSFQGKNLRKEISKLFKKHIGCRDLSEVKISTFCKVMDDIDKIEIKKAKHSISDFFNYLSSYLTGTNPFTKVRIHAHKRFTDEILDNRTLDSCTFGPIGSEREACLGYSADPNIELVFLSTYLNEKFMDNIGVGYMVNTEENVWLLDGVDAGPTAKQLPGLDWKEIFYDGLIGLINNSENPPDKVVMNVNLGSKKTPNEFLEYICKRKKIKYKKERTRVKVEDKQRIVLDKPLLSESDPEAYEATGTDKAYLEAWYDCAGSPWNTGRGEVEVIELIDFRK